ncbi:UBIQUITIN CARBOXYL-TERMINAL HYDROLASE-LIKE PROTEIN [Salix purpurea]|uniref:UBIQUITIN CARBOXYL-TERMINAL HYDROLASE-LIKE PROTEIN n=1 Tax=Salix purpurea TaxID=77065 RepID=A0A9Q1A8R5_SALPP|nr:UBIQUITIN CARBOXYL-TERMINAL HYDROLASE-LIKE PROTEIN [Salix purpurea]
MFVSERLNISNDIIVDNYKEDDDVIDDERDNPSKGCDARPTANNKKPMTTLMLMLQKKKKKRIRGRRTLLSENHAMVLQQPPTLESSSTSTTLQSQTSDPNHPDFTFDMLKSLIETNDFYSKECNPHSLDSTTSTITTTL